MNIKRTTLWLSMGIADAELITVRKFTGAPELLWRIDQLVDGTYRIMPKAVSNSAKKLPLVSSGDSTPMLAEFNFNSDNSFLLIIVEI